MTKIEQLQILSVQIITDMHSIVEQLRNKDIYWKGVIEEDERLREKMEKRDALIQEVVKELKTEQAREKE